MAKFVIEGTVNVEVTVTIEAESEEEAQSEFDTADFCLESTSTCTVNESNQSGSSVDKVTWPAADKWELLDPLDRAIILKKNGVSNDAAFEVAQRECLDDIDEEWWDYFED